MPSAEPDRPTPDVSIETERPTAIYQVLKAANVEQVAYIPDAGHTTLINLFSAGPDIASNVLTTEEEGVAIGAGAWLLRGRPSRRYVNGNGSKSYCRRPSSDRIAPRPHRPARGLDRVEARAAPR